MIRSQDTIKGYYYKLESEARKLGYRVSYSSVNKACHHPNYVIFIRNPEDISNVFSYAHEIGHCIDFKKGDLDFNRYRIDKRYRQYKESVAWLLGYKVCLQLGIPKEDFWSHAHKCYKSYL